MMKLAFGKPKANPATLKPSTPFKNSAFGDDDEQEPAVPIPSTSKGPVPSTRLSREQKKLQEQAQALDSSVYEYDEVYDYMKVGERKAAEERAKENAERKPRYMEGLLKTAAQRKLDHAAAEDKMMERERAREGGQFADKDAFVTPAYLAQQEEIRQAEEEERRRNEAAAKKRPGLPAFYAEYLDSNEAAHAAAMKAAAEKPVLGPTMPPPSNGSSTLSEAAQAMEASKRLGRDVVVNDDGQIVDKRELLVGGLNLSQKPQTASGDTSMGFAVPIAERVAAARAQEQADALEDERNRLLPNGLTQAQRHRLMRERQSAEIEKQLLESQAKKRAAEEAEAAATSHKYVKRTASDRVEELRRQAAERRAAREAALLAEVANPHDDAAG